MTLLFLSICTTMLFAQPESIAPEQLLRSISKGFAEVAKETIPAVVYIESKTKKKPSSGPHENPFDFFQDDFFNRFFNFPNQPKEKARAKTVRGSGFVVTADGYILTNNHVVENASKVEVTFDDGKKLDAKVIGLDPKTDLAIIKIEGKNFPFIRLGDSDKIEVGDWAIACGNPFGLQASITVGVVSAKGRNQLNIADFEDFIQTDAAINPGNSGGPLLNIDSEVIGINTAIVSGSGGYMGIGFAIPSNMAKRIMDQLIENGVVTRGFLGVTLQAIDSDLASFYKLDGVYGALVTDVVPDSPAAKGGLEQEDIITHFNGKRVENISLFRNAVSLMKPGSKLTLKVLRDGKVETLKFKVGSAPDEKVTAEAQTTIEKLGLQVQDLTPEVAEKLGYRNAQGVIVSGVEKESLAADARIRPGALIMAVNRQPVSNTSELMEIMQKSSSEGRILLMVRQGEVVRFVPLRIS